MSATVPSAGRKAWLFALASAGYGALLLALYFAHMHWLRVDVVFYASVFDALLAVGLAALALAWLRAFAGFNGFEKGLMLLAWALLGYAFAISVPTVIDRSLSFYFLEKIQQHGGGLRVERFEDVFTRGYAREHQLVAVRLTEQLASGTVTIEDGCVRLTARGQRLADFSRFFRRHLLPRQRLLMGRYTDALVDPFRAGGSTEGSCGAGTPARN
jgi:hypothetical protein